MFIFIKLKKLMTLLLIVLFISGIGFYLQDRSPPGTTVLTEENLEDMLPIKVQEIIDSRNKAILKQDSTALKKFYNEDNKYSLWAYQHELRKMNYLHKWAIKQGVEIKDINSQVIVTNMEEKEDEFTMNLLVSTEYQYSYQDEPDKYNSFRLGTYHYLDLSSQEKGWIIKKEWYRDPLSTSVQLNQQQNLQEFILAQEAKDISDLKPQRTKALKYANKYCGAATPIEYDFQYNKEYRNFNHRGGDCANFASQILHEGGGFKKSSTWDYNQRDGTKAWLNAHAFNRYMTHSGRASVIDRGTYDQVLKSSYELLPGDYIAYENQGSVEHISVVTGIDSKGYILVNSHNADRYRVPWDLGWSPQTKFWLVRVHY
ncbi:amidase domain-containing protein [Halanaerobaculum tunisiense]